MEVLIRRANIDDVESLAQIKATCWKTSFEGIVEAGYLASLSPDSFVSGVRKSFEVPTHRVWVAMAHQTIVGFGIGSPSRFGCDAKEGEIHTLFIAPSHHSRGIGKRLVRAISCELESQGYLRLVVWTFSQNARAVRFYERLGAAQIRTKECLIGGQSYEEVCLCWPSIRTLAQGVGSEPDG